MKTFKEYREEQKRKRGKEETKKYPAMETFFGKHSEQKKTMETSFGKHSEPKKKVNEATIPEEDDTQEQKHIHEHVAPMGKLDHHETGAIKNYTDDSAHLNKSLHKYHGGEALGEKQKQAVGHLDNILNRHKTKEDTHVYTGIHRSPSAHFEHDDNGHPREHAYVHLPAYTSTSTDENYAQGFSKEHHHVNDEKHGITDSHLHVLKIHLPKGTHAASVRGYSYFPHEQEVLLHRGHDIKIHKTPEKKRIPGRKEHYYLWHGTVVGHSPVKV